MKGENLFYFMNLFYLGKVGTLDQEFNVKFNELLNIKKKLFGLKTSCKIFDTVNQFSHFMHLSMFFPRGVGGGDYPRELDNFEKFGSNSIPM